MILDSVAQVLTVMACAVILWRTEPAINRMSESTPLLIRCAFMIIALGSTAELSCTVVGKIPSWPSVLGSCGTAALLLCERRLRYLVRHPIERKHPRQQRT